MNHVNRHFSFLRATAIGGIFFLLPLVVLGVLLGKVGQVIYAVVVQVQPILHDWLGIDGPAGYALIVAIVVLVIVLLCFMAGMMAGRSIARRFTSTVEKYLLMMFPRYAIFKEQLSGNIGGEIAKNQLHPVCVQLEGYTRLGFEVERTERETVDAIEGERQNMHDELVTVFLPGSPDPWTGTVINVSPDRVSPIETPFPDVLGAFEKLGQDSQKILRGESVYE
ncbi:DUF502 domain-containing protein [Allorhodopirellula solitaria]|uniref:DUF502 domain-containing protein n=1 Tax=Allorhodopirellula solitaria TaxID=2527987 RepID=A0A5C5XVF8_9BACT|nr:DUF502 domain-containing protein [Allorhodopirellula solitaria]TWT66561.1 hypothetical protein CA85_26580 [Allorhodopirellula solitaria]